MGYKRTEFYPLIRATGLRMATGKHTVLDIAAEVLKRATKPLTYEEIWEVGKELPMASTLPAVGRPPGTTLGARLLVDTRDNPRTRFMKLGRSPTRFWLVRRRADLTDAHFKKAPAGKGPPKQKTPSILLEAVPQVGRHRKGVAGEAMPPPGAQDGTRFLGRICNAVAVEFDLLLKDRARSWRGSNLSEIIRRAEEVHRTNGVPKEYHADPRLVGAIVEHGSWSRDDLVRGYWGGLLASSCCVDGTDDSNLVWIDLLSRLTVSQVRIVDHACREAPRLMTETGLLPAERLQMSARYLVRISGIADLARIQRELAHLCSLGLLELPRGGFTLTTSPADVTPSSLAFHFFTRARGFAGNPVEYLRRQGTEPDPPGV